jgi:hypothetical protein
MNPCSETAPQKRPDPSHKLEPAAEGVSGRRNHQSKAVTMIAASPTKRSNPAIWPVALALVAAMACAGSPAFAQATPDDEYYDHVLNTDKRIIDTILGAVGLGSRPGAIIDYRERSPLVVPPVRSLPPPEANAARTNPEWPVDPEIRQAAADRKSGRHFSVDFAEPLGPAALSTRGSSTLSGGPIEDPGAPGALKEKGFLSRLIAGELWGTKEEVGTFEGEPPRRTLTAPPSGYQTPSPAAPYGVTNRPYEAEKADKRL